MLKRNNMTPILVSSIDCANAGFLIVLFYELCHWLKDFELSYESTYIIDDSLGMLYPNLLS